MSKEFFGIRADGTVFDRKQGITRGSVYKTMAGHWRACYPCKGYVDNSGSESVVRFFREVRLDNVDTVCKGYRTDLYMSGAELNHATGKLTGALCFRTRRDAAHFLAVNF